VAQHRNTDFRARFAFEYKSFMKWAGMLVWTIQIARRKPEWFQTNSDCQQGVGTFPEKKKEHYYREAKMHSATNTQQK